MRSFFTLVSLVITFFILTACSSQQVTVTSAQRVTVTLPSTSTPLPIPTGTPVPSATPTATPTIVTYSVDDWGKMDETAKYAAVPEIPEYAVGGLSALEGLDHMVIYYDAKGDYAGAQNMLTGKFEKTGTGAIEVFRTTDDGYYEMRAVGKEGMDEEQSRKAVERALEMAIVEDGVKYGYPTRTGVSNINTFYPAIRSIKDCEFAGGVDFGLKVPNATTSMEVDLRRLVGGSIFIYSSYENLSKSIYVRGVSPELFKSMALDYENTNIPAKP